MADYLIVTNNPKVRDEWKATHEVLFCEGSFTILLESVRDRIHTGAKLLTHPLSGSVKPNETPYKSVLITKSEGAVDAESLNLIESAIATAKKFPDVSNLYDEKVHRDFQTVDAALLKSAITSADR